jgi:hypothetical protein
MEQDLNLPNGCAIHCSGLSIGFLGEIVWSR